MLKLASKCFLEFHARSDLTCVHRLRDTVQTLGTVTCALQWIFLMLLGARGDSYYEYLLKRWLLTNRTETIHRQRYEHAVNGIMSKLIGYSKPNNWTFVGEWKKNALIHKMDHLVCFLPGVLALGYVNQMPATHLDLAERLLYSCYQMYKSMPSGLAPEIVQFSTAQDATTDLSVKPNDAFNILRPETVESLMILYRVTKNETYREWGREIFSAFEKHCRVSLQ